MFRYPQYIQRYEDIPHNPYQPTIIKINDSEVKRITKRTTFNISRQPNIGIIYGQNLNYSNFFEFEHDAELRIKWTTYRSENVDTLLTLNGKPHFDEQYNIIANEEIFSNNGIFTTITTKEIRKGRSSRHKFKTKLERVFQNWRHKLKFNFKRRSPCPNSVELSRIISPPPTRFCVSTFHSMSDLGFFSSGCSTPLSDLCLLESPTTLPLPAWL